MEHGKLLLYVGIALMAIAAVTALVCLAVFRGRAKELKRRLEAEYGPEKKPAEK